jgi:hypothetical protein
MKTEAIITKPAPPIPSPILRLHKKSGEIWLFASADANSATLIHSPNGKCIGETRSEFFDCEQSWAWQDLPSGTQVIITQ